VDFRILGPFEADDDAGAAIALTAGKQKALLALLLLHADGVVAVDRLVEDLWGEDVPETATKMVQILVSQLRKQLPDGLLRTRAPGYLVDLDGHSLDVRRFDELVAAGREALGRGRAEEAATSFRAALALWRGPALAEFEEPFAQLESSRLEEQRLACLEERIEADLELARHTELVGELDSLARRHAHRQRFREQLLLALYRSGRHAEALESYQEFRRMLADELGIEPSTRLRNLERRMLQQDPSLDVAARPQVLAAPRPVQAPPGRERELAHLDRLLERSLAGERTLVFVTGDAGIGKTTIVESFLGQAGSSAETLVGHGQCVAHRGAGEAYLPILEALSSLVRGPGGARFVPLLARQAPTWIAQMPWLLDDDELEAVQRRLVGAPAQRMLREMVETLETISGEIPVVLVLEDLHWSDFSTIDLLNSVARRREPARLLVLGTYRRSDAVAQAHPVFRLGQELRGRGLCTEIAVGPLSQDALADYAAVRVGAGLSQEVAGVLRERTGGNPLFAKTLLDSWLEHGLLDETPPDLERLAHHVPETVRGLIEQMLDELDPADRDLLSAASAVGQEFSAAAVAAATTRPETDVDLRCDALAQAGRFVERAGEELWPDGTVAARYRFAHDLHREVLYDGLPSARRAQVHARLGVRLDAAYAPNQKEIAAQLAEHFVRAGDARRAVGALRLAAEQAVERLAHREAFEHLEASLRMLQRLPDDPDRRAAELELQPMLGAAHIALRGWSAPEAESAFLRARELAEHLDRRDDLAWSLFRLGTLFEVRGDYERSRVLLEETLAVSGPSASKRLLTDSHELLACVRFHQGAFADSLDHAEQGLAAFDEEYVNKVAAAYGDNAGVSCHSWAALSLWFLGFPDLARRRAREAVALADDARRRHGYATALAHAAILEQCLLDSGEARAHAEAAMEAAARGGYQVRLAMATILHGWALAAEGSCEDGVAELEHGLALSRATGAHMDDPYFFALLADARLRAGDLDGASAAVDEGLAEAPTDRSFFFESELHRLAGEVLLRLDRGEEAEARLRTALELAREHGSPSLELRAALSLARRLCAEGQDDEARELTAGPYARFTEGFETHDLVAARELLQQLPA